VAGVAEGCVQAGCGLIGGETAEMPGMYGEDDYDLAGFAVGIADKSQIIDGSKVKEGDILLGLASSGIHSNGYSLVRRVFADFDGDALLPELNGKALKDVLLEPTRIYVQQVLPLVKDELVNGIAHITGGGFIENIPRMFSDDLAAEVEEDKIPVLPIFTALETYGKIKHEEMFEIFNMEIVIGRTAEMRIVDINTGISLSQHNIPYGATLFFKDGDSVKKGDKICEWDAYNAVTIAEYGGKVAFDSLIEGVTYREEAADEYSMHKEKVVIESRDKSRNPTIKIMEDKMELKQYNLPVGAHIMVENGQKIKSGDIIVKIPRAIGKSGDITGGLPRVTELFEARNPSNPAIVAEINGEVQMGKIKRGNREIIIRSKTGEEKRYSVPLSKQILVQENDYVRAGMPLSDGAISPTDILAIQGPTKVQEYIVNEIQEVYRLQGVKINDKHFEIIVRQMMRKV
jgi:phosphotransferase system IIA component